MIDYKISDEYDGCTRKLFRCECKKCFKEFWRPKHILNKVSCCSRECLKLFREKVGKRVEINCTQCGIKFKRFQHLLARVTSKHYFCSRNCQKESTIKNKGNCLNCNTLLSGKSKIYCSHDCQWRFKYKYTISEWKMGKISGMDAGESINCWLRHYMIEKYGNKCSQCGWNKIKLVTGKVPIQIDHIDGDYKNNKENNLRILCPNCHSLTPTYGALNKGKGREKRRLKLQQIQSANILL